MADRPTRTSALAAGAVVAILVVLVGVVWFLQDGGAPDERGAAEREDAPAGPDAHDLDADAHDPADDDPDADDPDADDPEGLPAPEEEPGPGDDRPPPDAGADGPAPGAAAAWDGPPDAVVGSWAALRTAVDDGAAVVHLEQGSYGDTIIDTPGVFVRNVPGDRVIVAGTFVAAAPDITLAGVEVAGRFEGRESGDGATLYRSVLTGAGAVTFNGTRNGQPQPLLGRLIEVHSLDAGPAYSGQPDVWAASNIVTVNHGASVELDGVWLTGRHATKDVVQVINGGRDATVRNSYLGRGPSATLHLITDGKIVIEDTYLDWSPHPIGGGIGWEMRSPEVTLRNVVAFRPFWRLGWNPSFTERMTIEGSTFYTVPEIQRTGSLLFDGNTAVDASFPDNRYATSKPPAPTRTDPSWWNQLG